MKINDIVSLINIKEEYKSKNLYLQANGLILKLLPDNKCLVLFFNDKIVGDYAVVEINIKDLKKSNIKLPSKILTELNNSDKFNDENFFKKQSFKQLKFNEFDFVELLVEDKKYTKNGIHKGDIGVVAMNYAVDNSILVDFSGVDEQGNYYGDCIEVSMNDLKLLQNK